MVSFTLKCLIAALFDHNVSAILNDLVFSYTVHFLASSLPPPSTISLLPPQQTEEEALQRALEESRGGDTSNDEHIARTLQQNEYLNEVGEVRMSGSQVRVRNGICWVMRKTRMHGE